MKIGKDKVVLMHYELKNDKGEILDSSKEKEPLAYIHGKSNIIAGLEKQLVEKKVGDKLNVTVAPEEAYGVKDEHRIFNVGMSKFEGDEELKVGMQIELEVKGEMQVGIVAEINGDKVTLDLNHPLAGETLTFDVEIMEVRDASTEELAHGHVHGKGGHHH